MEEIWETPREEWGLCLTTKYSLFFYCETNWNFAIHHFTSKVKSELSREKRPGKSLKGPFFADLYEDVLWHGSYIVQSIDHFLIGQANRTLSEGTNKWQTLSALISHCTGAQHSSLFPEHARCSGDHYIYIIENWLAVYCQFTVWVPVSRVSKVCALWIIQCNKGKLCSKRLAAVDFFFGVIFQCCCLHCGVIEAEISNR